MEERGEGFDRASSSASSSSREVDRVAVSESLLFQTGKLMVCRAHIFAQGGGRVVRTVRTYVRTYVRLGAGSFHPVPGHRCSTKRSQYPIAIAVPEVQAGSTPLRAHTHARLTFIAHVQYRYSTCCPVHLLLCLVLYRSKLRVGRCARAGWMDEDCRSIELQQAWDKDEERQGSTRITTSSASHLLSPSTPSQRR